MSITLSTREQELLMATMELDGKVASDWFALLICYKGGQKPEVHSEGNKAE